jgi:aryl-alcohol dehydrogenase-like predicted oxidoreductase
MEKRKFGKMNHEVTILTLGGAGLGNLSQETADIFIKQALDANLNMIDVAPSYGNAEERLSKWVKEYREDIFLSEKTQERTKKGAKNELESSLKILGTDYFDLYQFHAVKSMEELNIIFGKGGTMETFLEAKESGIIKNIGLTGHHDIQVHLEAMKRFDFDSLLLPINITSNISPDPVNDYNLVLKKALAKNIGIIAIKAIQKNRWRGNQKYNTWYEPFDDQESITDSINFTLSQEGVTTYAIAGETKLWNYILKAGKEYSKLNKEEQQKLINKYSKKSTSPLFPTLDN